MPWATLVLGTLILGFIWTLHYHQYDRARDDVLATNAAEHLNLATILAENFRQITDRAQAVVGQIVGGLDEADGQWRLTRWLASDPLFNRLGLYDAEGRALFSSHAPLTEPLTAQTLAALQAHVQRFGFVPYLAAGDPAAGDPATSIHPTNNLLPAWRLPLLVPLPDEARQSIARIVRIDLDIGYLARLYQHIDFGLSGFVQLLDASGRERLRANGGGIIHGAAPLVASHTPSPDLRAGRYTSVADGLAYQSLFRHLPELGVSLVVSQQYRDITAAIDD
ncbi:MAG TPA: cache domain-containing protein, partial [Pseudomonas sp.]|nr:cache domain-containing protein [Pseudomonas sp.]